ncbi:MAG TPA: amino acid ABC transporter substrate-binding protein [Acetobacteraceae bacterium]
MTRLLLAAALAVGLAGAAQAEDGAPLTGTLKAVAGRGTLLIGVRNDAPPFSFRNPGGQPVGFSVDICRGIAADVAAALNRDLVEADAPAWQTGVRIVYVPVAADARVPLVASGAVDLECGSTTATEARARVVAFSPVFFLAGTKLLAPAGSAIASPADLAGKTVVVGAGTTNAEVMRRLAARAAPAFTVAEEPTLDAAYARLGAGRADAFASDDILLAGLVATRPDGGRFRIVGDFLSYEPYAVMLRRDDPAFSDLVRGSFGRMARDGALTASYGRWLTGRLPNGESLNLPMSAHLAQMYSALGDGS